MRKYSLDKLKEWYKRMPKGFSTKLSAFFLAKRFFNKDARISYSHTGEDCVLAYLLKPSRKGFFIDVGCNHPVINNNTFSFYLEGWNGINIDPNRELISLFKSFRKKDISICAAVSNKEEEVVFYKSAHSEVSTISKGSFEIYKKIWPFTESEKITTKTLNSILSEYVHHEQEIDLLTIDVEGHDFEVLQSIDLVKYRPKVIMMEAHDFSIQKYSGHNIVEYLRSFRFDLKYFSTKNLYFTEQNFDGDYFDVLENTSEQ